MFTFKLSSGHGTLTDLYCHCFVMSLVLSSHEWQWMITRMSNNRGSDIVSNPSTYMYSANYPATFHFECNLSCNISFWLQITNLCSYFSPNNSYYWDRIQYIAEMLLQHCRTCIEFQWHQPSSSELQPVGHQMAGVLKKVANVTETVNIRW